VIGVQQSWREAEALRVLVVNSVILGAMVVMLIPRESVLQVFPYSGTTLFGLTVTGLLFPYALLKAGSKSHVAVVASGVLFYSLVVMIIRIAGPSESVVRFDFRTGMLDALTFAACIVGAAYPHMCPQGALPLLRQIGVLGMFGVFVAGVLTYTGHMATNSAPPRMSNDTLYMASGLCVLGAPALATASGWAWRFAPVIACATVAALTLARSAAVLGGCVAIQAVVVATRTRGYWQMAGRFLVIPIVVVLLVSIGWAVQEMADVRDKSALDSTGRIDELVDVVRQLDAWDLVPGLGFGMGVPKVVLDQDGLEVDAISLSLHINVVLPILKFGVFLGGSILAWYLWQVIRFGASLSTPVAMQAWVYTIGLLLVIMCLGGGWGPLFGFFLGVATEEFILRRDVWLRHGHVI
jgi:hypothetical protein